MQQKSALIPRRFSLIARFSLLTGAAVIAAVHATVFNAWVQQLGTLLGLILAAICVSTWMARSSAWDKNAEEAGRAVTLADPLILTVLVYITGAPYGGLTSLYLPHVLIVSLLFSRHQAVLFATIAGSWYWLLTTVVVAKVAQSYPGVPTGPAGAAILHAVGISSAMILIAAATHVLIRQLSQSVQVAAESQESLSRLAEEQRELFETFPEASILTDNASRIITINSAALKLLSLTSVESQGRAVEAVLHAKNAQITFNNGLPSGEFETVATPTEKARRIVIATQDLRASDGSLRGHLVILRDITELRSAEELIQRQERMAQLLADDSPSEKSFPHFESLVGESPVMSKVFQLIQRVSPTDATVMINGESGTGKELVARALHSGSLRARGPFVAVNCGAIPENLLESEFFGHKKGSFTGADSDALGLFRSAEGGTLFLDEIGELPLALQSKLLRSIQDRAVRPVGTNRDVPIDVRIIAATNRNLRREIEQGGFREDLFYRLNVINITLPPLRDRKEDLELLIRALLKRLAGDKPSPAVSPRAMDLLLQYKYPGNVRELENVLERGFVLGGSVILPEHLPDQVRIGAIEIGAEPGTAMAGAGPVQLLRPETRIIELDNISFPVQLDDILSGIERRYLERALDVSSGGKKKAAELLGINFRSLRYRLQKFGIGGEDGDGV